MNQSIRRCHHVVKDKAPRNKCLSELPLISLVYHDDDIDTRAAAASAAA